VNFAVTLRINILKTKVIPQYIKFQFVPRSKHSKSHFFIFHSFHS